MSRYTQLLKLTLCCLACCISTIARADYYRFLVSEREAIQCRLDLITQAQTEILISSYIIQDDEAGLAILHALLQAHERGVRVCVLMDGNASSVNKYLAWYMIDRGVDMKKFFLKGSLELRRYYHRLHDKMLLVDAKKMIAGGRNLKKPYFELHPDHNFIDRDVYVESISCGATARQHFYYMWNAKRLTSRLPSKQPSEARTERITNELKRCRTYVQEKCKLDSTTINWSVGLDETETPVQFVHDKFYGKVGDRYVPSVKKDAGSTDSLILLIERAQTQITLENPYIVPSRKWMQAFKRARERGVKIKLLTNSVKSNDVLISQAAYMNIRHKLIKLGIEIWEYQGPKQFHAKTATIDDCVSIVGSYNIHNPSERFNSEVAVWVYDQEIAKEHRLGIESYMKDAVRIGTNNKPDATTFPGYKPAKVGRRARILIWRWTIAWAFGGLL